MIHKTFHPKKEVNNMDFIIKEATNSMINMFCRKITREAKLLEFMFTLNLKVNLSVDLVLHMNLELKEEIIFSNQSKIMNFTRQILFKAKRTILKTYFLNSFQ